MKNKLSYAIATLALTLFFSTKTFAQQTVAHLYTETPVASTEKTATFQVVFDNIDNEAEKTDFMNKFKASKKVADITASAITDKKVTYTITMDKDGIFFNFQDALKYSGVDKVDFLGRLITTSEFGQTAKMEYDNANKKKAASQK